MGSGKSEYAPRSFQSILFISIFYYGVLDTEATVYVHDNGTCSLEHILQVESGIAHVP